MNDLMDDYTPDFEPGDRVVLGEGAGNFVGTAGVVLKKEEMYSIFYNTDVYVVMSDEGEKIAAFKGVIIKSPYQNEPLEEVPSV